MDNEFFSGVAGDPREDAAVRDGWKAEEVIAGDAPVEWKAKTTAELKQHPIWSQYQSGACVAFSKARQVSIEVFRLTGVWLDFSPASIYQLRKNKPGFGMYISDANDIVNKKGATLEALMRSQNLTEAQINSVKRTKVATMISGAIGEAVLSYLYLPNNIERIAQAIDRGHGVSMLIYAKPDEYTDTPKIKYPDLELKDAPIVHEIVATDFFVHPTYGKCLWIDDSWGVGTGMGGHRIFTEEFVTKRCVLADYLDAFDFEPGVSGKPSYDGTIISVQKCLKFEGFFPSTAVHVENFGPITKKGLGQFQAKYGLTVNNLLDIPTVDKLSDLYP